MQGDSEGVYRGRERALPMDRCDGWYRSAPLTIG
jgi:hypothetical protein